ncbi:MAG TPA: response regulator [Nodosilinea sp.]|nr:response regulator [Nodosilinea sp.]
MSNANPVMTESMMAKPATASPAMLRDVQILVVDNDADSRFLYATLFEPYGAKVTGLDSVGEALDQIRSFTPDILICEIRFINETIFPLLRQLRASARQRQASIPVLVVSAYCSAKLDETLRAQVTGQLLKPIDIHQLVDEVWGLVQLSRQTGPLHSRDRQARLAKNRCDFIQPVQIESLVNQR